MKSKKLSERNLNILLIAFSVACSLLIVIVSYHYYPHEFVENRTFEVYESPFFIFERVRYPSKVEIVEEGERMLLGFVTDPWNLNFGIIPLGGYGTRNVKIFNSENYSVRVKLYAYGSINPLIKFEKNDLVLKPNETLTINIFLNTTNSTKPGNYTGEIDIVIKKPKYSFLQFLV